MLPTLQKKEKSITECLSPLYRKVNDLKFKTEQPVSHSQKQSSNLAILKKQYNSVSNSIDNLEVSLNNRMSVHEKQLLQIMRVEIQRMLGDVQRVVEQFNAMIKQKNYSQQLWEITNEVQYFKYEAIRLFEENKELVKQINVLKKQIQQQKFQSSCRIGALRNIAKKLQKTKAQRNALSMIQLEKIKTQQNNQKFPTLIPSKCQLLNNVRKSKDNIHKLYKTPDKIRSVEENNDDLNPEIRNQSNYRKEISKLTQELTTQATYRIQNPTERVIFLNSPTRHQNILRLKQKLYFYRNHRGSEQKQTVKNDK